MYFFALYFPTKKVHWKQWETQWKEEVQAKDCRMQIKQKREKTASSSKTFTRFTRTKLFKQILHFSFFVFFSFALHSFLLMLAQSIRTMLNVFVRLLPQAHKAMELWLIDNLKRKRKNGKKLFSSSFPSLSMKKVEENGRKKLQELAPFYYILLFFLPSFSKRNVCPGLYARKTLKKGKNLIWQRRRGNKGKSTEFNFLSQYKRKSTTKKKKKETCSL